MDLSLSDTEQMLQKTARQLARTQLAPFAAEWDRTEAFPHAAMRQLNELGLLSMLVKESDGGSGAGPLGYALCVSELAEGCPSTTVTMMVTNMVADAISRFGSTEQKAHYLPKFADGTYECAAFSLSEPGAGSDAANVRCTAEESGDEWVITGEKAWVTSASYAPLFLLMARTGDKISAFLIERGTKGLSVSPKEHKMGLRASPTCSLVLDAVRVKKSAMLGAQGSGLKIALTALDGGRIGVGAQALGIGRAALKASIRYAKERIAFGKPIAEQQAIQWKLANMATELDAAELLVLQAAALRARGIPCSKQAAMAKAYSTEAANRACTEAVQIHGGYGYIGEFPVERHFRDARVTMIYEGTSEIQRVVIARSVLGM